MTRALIWLIAVVPSLALAGTGSDASLVRMDVGGGLVGAWAAMTKGIAFSFLPFLFIVSIAAEAWGKGPAEQRDFGKVVQRFVVILVLLSFYGQVFGSLAGMLNGAANSIAPTETWAKLQASTKAFLEAKAQYQDREMNAASGAGSTAMQWVAGQVDALGGTLIDSAVTLIVLGGQAAFRIVGTLGAVLSGLLYVLGPLAIAASMPASSDAGTKWLRVFISVLSWPLISSVLVGLLTGYALDALKPNDSYEAAYSSIVLAGILTVTAFAVPVVASALTGTGMGAVGAGWSSLNAWSGAAATAGAAMTGASAAAGVMQRAAPSPAPQLGGGGGGGGGAGGGGLQSSAPSSGHGGDWSARERDLNPAWAAKASVGSIAPAQASVSPARDVAAAADIANGGGVNFPPSEPAQPQPPPVAWSQGGIVPGGPDDSTPTQKPSPAPMPGPAARPTPPTRPGQRGAGVMQNASAPRAEAPRKELANALPKGSEEAFQKWAAQNPGKDWRQHRDAILDMHHDEELRRRGGIQQAARAPEPLQPTKPLNKKS